MSRLKAALDPKSVAVIGASENPNKVGGRPIHYLDKFGFKGKIFPINPSRTEVQGYKCYNSLADLTEATRKAASEALAQMLAVTAMLVIASVVFYWH